MKIPEKLDFLTAPRFWASVVVAMGTTLVDPNFPNQAWYINLGKFLIWLGGIFTTVGTIDRAAEQIGGDAPTKSEK